VRSQTPRSVARNSGAEAMLLPAQLLVHSGARRSPELRLVAAVLEEALQCIGRYVRSRSAPRREFQEVCTWFFEHEQEGPFAFETVCDLLGFDPAAVREQVRRRLGPASAGPTTRSGFSPPAQKSQPAAGVSDTRRSALEEDAA
jgi:hypothetical protein